MPADTESRPSPDALLTQAAREGRGRLKLFLGAAPGVGKTWAMLDDAHRLPRSCRFEIGAVLLADGLWTPCRRHGRLAGYRAEDGERRQIRAVD